MMAAASRFVVAMYLSPRLMRTVPTIVVGIDVIGIRTFRSAHFWLRFLGDFRISDFSLNTREILTHFRHGIENFEDRSHFHYQGGLQLNGTLSS